MDIVILVEKRGIRAQVTGIKSHATRIPGVHRTTWYGPETRTDSGLGEFVSLTHTLTGRALNKVPLTADECDRLLDALMDCDIEWDKVTDGESGMRYYADRLSDEAAHLAGRY